MTEMPFELDASAREWETILSGETDNCGQFSMNSRESNPVWLDFVDLECRKFLPRSLWCNCRVCRSVSALSHALCSDDWMPSDRPKCHTFRHYSLYFCWPMPRIWTWCRAVPIFAVKSPPSTIQNWRLVSVCDRTTVWKKWNQITVSNRGRKRKLKYFGGIALCESGNRRPLLGKFDLFGPVGKSFG